MMPTAVQACGLVYAIWVGSVLSALASFFLRGFGRLSGLAKGFLAPPPETCLLVGDPMLHNLYGLKLLCLLHKPAGLYS